ncbi:Penicillinase repressor [Bacteroides faecichinchillae]|uniref:Penicillinase repressor n=1 Tax=Bacteroides faecichinchillae TaxID=871325 RepID=A0A1M5CPR4_9BACE|nr:Penicillinase repressor [Bacteroides faecichinchillae]
MEGLTHQEKEVMIYFWRMGPSFIREVVNEMPDLKPLYTSVASVVLNLEKKKYLSPFKFRKFYSIPFIGERKRL